MSRFSETVMAHFHDPRHRGTLMEPTHIGTVGVPGRGPFFVLQLRVRAPVIEEAAFQCNACGITIACGSLLSDWLIGKSLEECRGVTLESLLELSNGLPPDKRYCAANAVQALQLAIQSPVL